MTARSGIVVIALVAALALCAVGWNHARLKTPTAPQTPSPEIGDEPARTLNRARMNLAGAELARDEQRRILDRERGAPQPAGPTLCLPGAPDALQRTLHDPEVNLLQIEANRAARAVEYGSLTRQLNLSSDQVAEFDRILAEKEMRELDVYASGRAQDLPESDPALAALRREIEADAERDLRALLGDEGYAVFEEHDRTAMLRLTASSFAGAATASGTPLTPAQSEALVQILAESTPGPAQGRRVKSSQVDWDMADQRIKAIVTPAQWETLRWTEPSGPRGVGGRFFPKLTATIRAAREADAAAIAGTAP